MTEQPLSLKETACFRKKKDIVGRFNPPGASAQVTDIIGDWQRARDRNLGQRTLMFVEQVL